MCDCRTWFLFVKCITVEWWSIDHSCIM